WWRGWSRSAASRRVADERAELTPRRGRAACASRAPRVPRARPRAEGRGRARPKRQRNLIASARARRFSPCSLRANSARSSCAVAHAALGRPVVSSPARALKNLCTAAVAPALLAGASSARAESEERALPDYDGRGGRATTPGDVLLWVPRVILFPPYVLAQFVVRRPLGWLIAGAERAGVPAWLYDFFTFDEHRAGVVPTALLDFDFYPSVGLYGFWNDVGFRGHQLRLRGSFGGEEWLAAGFSERVVFDAAGRDRIRL